MYIGFNILRLKQLVFILGVLLVSNFKGYAQIEISYPIDNHDRIKAELYPDSINIKYTHDAVGNIQTKFIENPCSEKPTPVITPTGKISICRGDSIQLTASLGYSYKWSRGDTSRIIWVKQDGIYTVMVNLTPNCQRLSYPDTLILRPTNLSIITPDSFFCPGFYTILTSSHNGKYKWNTGDSTKNIVADTVKKYTLFYTDSTGCIDTVSKNTGFYPKPIASFYTPALCPGTAGYCLSTSTIKSGTMSDIWYFGDNTPISTIPYHSYSNAGTYTVKLITTSDKGCKDSTTNTLIVDQKPIAGFIVSDTSLCLKSNSFLFTDTSKFAINTSRIWNFGDASTDTSKIKTKVYANAGTYPVKLLLSSLHGCKDSAIKSISVKPIPTTSIISGNSNVYPDSTHAYSVASTSGSLYIWNVIKGTIKSGNGTNNTTIKWDSTTGNGLIKVFELSNKGCYGDTINMNVVIAKNFNLNVFPVSLHFDNLASSKKIAISSNMNWTAISNQPWLTLNKPSGLGNDSVNAMVTANSSSSTRNALITFSGGIYNQTVLISQDSTPLINDILSLNKDTVIFPFTGSNSTVSVLSNRSWTVNANQSWTAISPSFGNGNGSFNIITSSNQGIERNAVVYVSAGTANKSVYILQLRNSTGMNEVIHKTQISVFPNPTSGLFTIDFGNIENDKNIQVYDITGKLVKEMQTNTNEIKINLTSFSKGIYLLKLSTEKGNINSKVLLE